MNSLPSVTAAAVAAVTAAVIVAAAAVIPTAILLAKLEPPASPASSAAGVVIPVNSCVMVDCEPSIEGTIVTNAFATSIPLAMCSPPKPLAQLIQGHCTLADLALVIVVPSRSRVGFEFSVFIASKLSYVDVDYLEHVENVCQDLVRFLCVLPA